MRPRPLIRASALFVSTLFLAACEKSSSPTGDTNPPKEATPTKEAAPTSSAPASAPVSSAPTVADAGAATAVVTAAVDAGKGKDGGATTATKPVTKHVSGSNFALDLASPGCRAGAECSMTIKLVASGDYHVNKEYPYKFIATPAPSIELLGKPDAATFTRAAGDFVEQGEKTGTMTVRFKATSPGEAHVAGTYKFSVCSADQCQIEQEKLDLTIPVL